jgi:hypothetical protein
MLNYLKNPCMHVVKYLVQLHLTNLLFTALWVALAGHLFGFGIQMNMACGIDATAQQWSALFMSYPLALLPFAIYYYREFTGNVLFL